MNFDLPSSPPEMFFPAIRIEIPLDKEGGGSIAGGDINGPRNFSPKEKINTSLLRAVCSSSTVSCESIEAWDVSEKVFFSVPSF